jgi:cobaltochelatase CobS
MSKVRCKECGFEALDITKHLEKDCIGVERYLGKYGNDLSLIMNEIKANKLLADNRKKTFDTVRKIFGAGDTNLEVPIFEKPAKTTPVIDDNYVFSGDTLNLLMYAIKNPSEKVLLVGSTGSGKSTIIEQIASRLNYGFYRINFDNEITKSELIGQWTVQEKEMKYQYGVIPKAMSEGAILLIDEWDCAPAGVAMVLQAVLEGKPLNLSDTNEVIYPHPDFRIFATSNTAGLGDDTGLYQGTMPQNFAQLDRFTMVVKFNYQSKAVERKILSKNKGILSDKDIDRILDLAGLIRNAHKKGELFATISTRTLLNIVDKANLFNGDLDSAFTYAFFNKLNDGDTSVIKEFVQRVFGSDKPSIYQEEVGKDGESGTIEGDNCDEEKSTKEFINAFGNKNAF